MMTITHHLTRPIVALTTASLILFSSTGCAAQPTTSPDEPTTSSTYLPPNIPQAGEVTIPAGGKKAPLGYYRQPSIRGNTIVFMSEGDLWKVPVTGGKASRLTTHHGIESNPVISPDGSTIAFRAQYEGPSEVYTMPIEGGLPTRQTFDSWRATPVNWTPDGRIIYTTSLYSTLPNNQLVILDPKTGNQERIPLADAGYGSFDDAGKTLFYHRLGQGSHTKRYKGGTAHQIWKFGDTDSKDEAVWLTADYDGTNKDPSYYEGRIYFASDRDGTMNIWSMNTKGEDLKQLTHYIGWEIHSPALDAGRIVYQYGADLRIYDIKTGNDTLIPITLDTDFDQMREKWITNPMSWVSAAHISPDGDMVVLTARGEVFTSPQKQGRIIRITRQPGVRYRDARFLPIVKQDEDESEDENAVSDDENEKAQDENAEDDTKNNDKLDDGSENAEGQAPEQSARLLTLSDESGEVELWSLPADGMGERIQLTTDGSVLRWTAIPSPNGKWIAHTDKNWKLRLFNTTTRENKIIDQNDWGNLGDLTWSSDSAWLVYRAPLEDQYSQLRLYRIKDGSITNITTDRYNSYSPAWGGEGKFLYFLSDRSFRSLVGSPWGLWQPEPFFDATTDIFAIALQKDLRSPFAPDNELTRAEAKRKKMEEEKKKKHKEKPNEQEEEKKETITTDQDVKTESETKNKNDQPATEDDANNQTEETKSDNDDEKIKIDLEGIHSRLHRVPVGNGNYDNLFTASGSLYWIDNGTVGNRSRDLKVMKITNDNPEPTTAAAGINSVELSLNGKKLFIRKGNNLYIVNANGSKTSLDNKSQVGLNGWAFSLIPREEWRQMFTDAWRLERDYFYDPNMHGVDWPAMLKRYFPLVDRVSDRDELADVIAQMVSELSALHIFVYGGDRRRGSESIQSASLGALLVRDDQLGGYRIDHIYRADPDNPDLRSPLDQLDQDIQEGDIITKVNGIPVLSARNINQLLRNQSGKQVLLHIKKKNNPQENENDDKPDETENEYIVNPVSQGAARNLRYHEWERTRREIVEEKSDNQIGYIHLRAMGSGDIATWVRDYQPVFMKQGLIIDVRHNGGGNIDSWILNRLIRKAWFYWQGRVGKPTWNMHEAFRGHMVFLCDENTGSDGEAVTEGFRRLGLGKVIGVRTWGGEIWLSSSNRLVDRGIATAAEWGVYGPEGDWLIEGRGVEPDIEVRNMPHATFKGQDAQLDTAINTLLKEIAQDPNPVPPVPTRPDKSSKDNRKQ